MGKTQRQEHYLEVVEKFAEAKVAVIGDIILDHYIWGKVDRISPEAPVVVVSVDNEEYRAGGAGNVAANLAALGVSVTLVGVIGDDRVGDRLKDSLEAEGINTEYLYRCPNRPTTQKSRVIASSQQVVRVDWEEVGFVGQEYERFLLQSLERILPETNSIICSDYGKGALDSEALFAALNKRKSDIPVIIDPKAPHFSMYKGATVIKPNKKEASEASGIYIKTRKDALEAGKILKKKWDCQYVLITLGELGMVLCDGEKGFEIPTVAREVYDVSGAGDTVSAVIAAAMGTGVSPEEACVLANYGAGVVVSEVGTVALAKSQLQEAINEFS